MQSIESKILSRIHGNKGGWVFTPDAFLDLASRAAVDKSLSRLTKEGAIRRLARGLYEYSRRHPTLGLLSPDPQKIAIALAGKGAARLLPHGAYAANLLGLTEQVPAKVVYLTDGPNRLIRLGSQTIELRHTSPTRLAAMGRLSGLVIQGLRELGKGRITTEHVAHLKRTLPADKRMGLIRDLRHAPVWMHPILRDLAEA